MTARGRWRLGAVVLLLMVPCVATHAADQPSEAAADVQDLILLGPTRPLLLRLHVALDGQPFRVAWQARFDELFAAEDRDRDGRLSAEQATSLLNEMHGSLTDLPASDLASQLTDGSIDKSALQRYVARVLPNLSIKRRAAIGQGSALALFPLLDTDGNRQLSADELNAAERQLEQRDFNDDGVISAAELILDPMAIAAAADPAAADRNLSAQEGPVMLLDPGVTSLAIVARLLKHYDRDSDGKLNTRRPKPEVILPLAQLTALDADSDALLDRDELTAFAQHAPDLNLPFSFGQVSASERRRRPPAAPEGFKFRRTLQGGYELGLGDAQVKFLRDNRDPRQADLIEFRNFDRDANKYVDLQESQNAGIGKLSFAAMDSDGDGKVFKGELTSYVGRQNEAAAVRFQLIVTDIGQDLLKLLDLDQDYVLSTRELRMARNVLSTDDTNGDGVLAGDEIPQDFVFELVRGLDERSDPLRIRSSGGNPAEALSAGPVWFRKMDRNNDGDLSPREFLGPASKFSQLDANGDGLISRDEAEDFDKRGAK